MLLHGLAKDIWMEGLNDGGLEDNEVAFDEDEDGFIKATKQYILHSCPRKGAYTLHQRATANYKFKFKGGIEVAAHMTQFCTILKYTKWLPGDDYVQHFESKTITFD